MDSPGASLDAAIKGLDKNLAAAVETASQLSSDSDKITSEAVEAEKSLASDGGPGSIIDVTA